MRCVSPCKRELSIIAIQDKLGVGICMLLEGSKNRLGDSCSDIGVELNGHYSCSLYMIV